MISLLETAARGAAYGPWAGSGGGPWWVLVPLLWITLAATVIWLVARRRNAGAGAGEGAVGILAARYARGEIDTEEYRRRLDEIRELR